MRLRDPVLWAWLVIDLVAAGSLGWMLSERFHRIERLQAIPAPGAVTISKWGAWNSIYGCPRAPREDLRLPAVAKQAGMPGRGR